MKRTKKERQQLLIETIADNPFVTDEQLANQFGVSVQTIRLDPVSYTHLTLPTMAVV